MKSLYIKAQHCFQEQSLIEKPIATDADLKAFLIDDFYHRVTEYEMHILTLRMIPCRPGDIWQEGVVYEEGKDYSVGRKVESCECGNYFYPYSDNGDCWNCNKTNYTDVVIPKIAEPIAPPPQSEGELWKEQTAFQFKVHEWMLACFGPEIAYDKRERNHRFLEEALELVQAKGCTKEEAYMLVDYVFGRPVGDINEEIGGVMLTLAALCNVGSNNMELAAKTELDRVWSKIEKIRLKQKNKPRDSPLPTSDKPELFTKEQVTQLIREAFIEGFRNNGVPLGEWSDNQEGNEEQLKDFINSKLQPGVKG